MVKYVKDNGHYDRFPSENPQRPQIKKRGGILSMKLTKQIFSVLLVLAMVLSLCPIIPFAEETTPTVEAVNVGTKGTAAQQAGLAGINEEGSNVWYLSDLHTAGKLKEHKNEGNKVALDVNFNGDLYAFNGAGARRQIKAKLVDGYRQLENGVYYTATEIALGYMGTKYEKGLGVVPAIEGTDDNFIVYSTSSLNVDRFYAVVGGTGAVVTNPATETAYVDVEVYGCAAESYVDNASMEWVKLAYAEGIRSYLVAEFDVDITGYRYIKLVYRLNADKSNNLTADGVDTNSGCQIAFGDACFYSSTGAAKVDYEEGLGKAPQQAGLAGKAENAKNINYLSDLMADKKYYVEHLGTNVVNANYNSDLYTFSSGARKQIKASLDANGERTLDNGVTYKPTDIALGWNGIKYEKGIGVHPDAYNKADRYMTFDVSSLGAERFYAVVGATGATITNAPSDVCVTFEVWGGKYNSPSSFTKLAYADKIRSYVIAEFDVDISGYDYIKLVVKMTGTASNSSCAVAWGDACVYSVLDEVKQTAMGKTAQESMTGLPAGITSQYFLSDLYHTPALVSKVAAERKVDGNVVHTGAMLDGEYSGRLYTFSDSTRADIAAKLDADGTRTLSNGVAYKPTDIALGWNGTKYEKGLGVHPDAYMNPDRYLAFDVRGLNADYFYTVVGATGYQLTDPAATSANTRLGMVEIWASKGDSYDENGFVKIATVDGIRAYLVGEINVNIEGYNFIKLVYKMDDKSPNKDNSSCAMAFGNACVYSLDEEKYVPDFTTSGADKGVVDAGGSYTQHTYTGVAKAEVEAYEAVLTNAGWTLYDQSTKAGNYFATYVTAGDKMVHLNYFATLDGGRFQMIYGPDTWLVPTTSIGAGENLVTPSVTIMEMSVGTLSMVIQAADGSFFVIDGGYGNDGDTFDADGNPIWVQNPIYQTNPLNPASGIRDFKGDMQRLLTFLEDNKPAEHEKPQVYWMATHAHGDHVQIPYLIFWGNTDLGDGKKTNERIDLKGIIYNFPNFANVGFDTTHESEDSDENLAFMGYDRFVGKAVENFSGVKQYIYHTGNTLKFQGGEIEFLYTPEDARPYSMPTGNHTVGVWRFNFDGGKSLMITGDAQQTRDGYDNNDQLARAFGDYLKSDMLQVIHHGTNGGSEAFYNAVDADILFYGQLDENLDTDKRQLGTYPGYAFNKILRDGERVIYSCSQTNTVYIPTVTYNDNGKIKSEAVLYSEATAYQGTNPDGSYTFAEQFNTKEGYVFYGWSTTPKGVVEYKAGETANLTESVALYAVYAPAATVIPTMGKGPQQQAGYLTGMTGDIVKSYWLSDWYNGSRMVESVNSKVMLDENYNGDLLAWDGAGGRKQIKASLDANGERELANGIKYKPTDIALGYNGDKYEKGLGVHPNGVGAADRYIVYNVSGLTNTANYFYAVVGATGYDITNADVTNRKVTFELWGSKASENDADTFVKLASASGIRAYLIAEFNVDITGYNFIKLVVKMSDDSASNSSCAVAWGNAAVYSISREAMGKDGVLAGKAENATNINYLSDLYNTESKVAELNNKVVLDGNYNDDLYTFASGARYRIKAELDENGERLLANGISYKPTDIALGYNGTKFEKGLGVHPDAIGKADRYITYDVSGLNVDRFYAVVGATGAELTDAGVNVRRVEFEVWGSVDGTNFTQIARADKIRAYVIAELDVDITGYNFIKLVVKMDPTSDANTSCAVAWGDACVYSTSEEDHEHTAADAVVENKIDATCDAAGSYDSVVYCSGCGEEISRETIIVPALGHSYAYTNNGNNTHTYACAGCGDSVTEAHSYTNNACACGHTLIDLIKSSQATLEAMLRLDFTVDKSLLTGEDNYVVLTHTYA
ncbi:MAG: hypothetical protein E7448_01785, partial [Ruminococcaceae bacterium]|nr:hypothetical protein [Oscillospiraceae bacterium]